MKDMFAVALEQAVRFQLPAIPPKALTVAKELERDRIHILVSLLGISFPPFRRIIAKYAIFGRAGKFIECEVLHAELPKGSLHNTMQRRLGFSLLHSLNERDRLVTDKIHVPTAPTRQPMRSEDQTSEPQSLMHSP